MEQKLNNDAEAQLPAYILALKQRSPGEALAYRQGFLAGLKAAREGICRSIEGFERFELESGKASQ